MSSECTAMGGVPGRQLQGLAVFLLFQRVLFLQQTRNSTSEYESRAVKQYLTLLF